MPVLSVARAMELECPQLNSNPDVKAFYAAGRRDVERALDLLADRGVAIERGRALDFGCGIGRLTRALAEQFGSCDGVDVAASKIQSARALGEDSERVRFHHNDATDLRLFSDGSFDFIIACGSLQQIEPELMRGYLREFLRVLRPGGVALFDIPEDVAVGAELHPPAFQASLTLAGTIPPLAPGQIVPLRIRVHNDSPVPWPASARLQVGDRWRTLVGGLVVPNDALAAIESTIAPGGECELELTVLAPARPGDYELEVDLLQPSFGWFADRGSRPLKLPVVIAAEADAAETALGAERGGAASQVRETASVPDVEVHVLSRDEVIATLEAAGGAVLDVIEQDRRGRAIRGLDYVVARAVVPLPQASQPRRRAPQAAIEARIQEAIEENQPGPGVPSGQLLASDPERPERHALALRLLEDRADLVGFALTSTLKGAGRASTVLRGALRRALLEVLHRQTEHNRASDGLIRSHEMQLEALSATSQAQLELLTAADRRLGELERRLAPVEVNSVTLARRTARPGMRPGLDYLPFAERFGGTREEIRERQRRYVPRFEGLFDVIDAGCGRGEFLELLREAGVSAAGVDRDGAMVARCRERHLNVRQGDALHFLRGRPEDSCGGIFAGHLIEHLLPGEVVEFVELAIRRLRPGGVLVIETVNPMSLLAHATFHDDLTRIGPVAPLALQWLSESRGFGSVEIEYASPVPPERKLRPLPASAGGGAEVEAFNRGLAAANDLLFGFQEYALVARKPN